MDLASMHMNRSYLPCEQVSTCQNYASVRCVAGSLVDWSPRELDSGFCQTWPNAANPTLHVQSSPEWSIDPSTHGQAGKGISCLTSCLACLPACTSRRLSSRTASLASRRPTAARTSTFLAADCCFSPSSSGAMSCKIDVFDVICFRFISISLI